MDELEAELLGELLGELLAAERAGWEALRDGRGEEHYRQHLADGALMAFGFGVMEREGAIAAMAAGPPWASFELQDPRVLPLGPGAAALVYRAVARRDGQEPFVAVIGSTYVRSDAGWRLALHQQSPAV